MLRGMNEPLPPGIDRRTVPRHLRDSEHDAAASTGAFGQRAEDALSRRGRGWALTGLAFAVALAAWWFWR
jgi:hypothetical protein